MSYNFTVKVDEEGNAEVEGQPLQHVPAGSFQISGHSQADGKNESLNVTRRNEDNQVVTSAQVWHA